jgi:hypothetical protein
VPAIAILGDGGTIYLQKGNYSANQLNAGNNVKIPRNYWILITRKKPHKKRKKKEKRRKRKRKKKKEKKFIYNLCSCARSKQS